MQAMGCHEAVKQGRTESNQHKWTGVELSSHTRVGRSCHAMALPILINRGVDGSWRKGDGGDDCEGRELDWYTASSALYSTVGVMVV
jgi:hypothetical protein